MGRFVLLSSVLLIGLTACLGEGGTDSEEEADGLYPCEGELAQTDVEVMSVNAYTWNGEDVILVSYECCDFFEEVYDVATCELQCAPTGGFTGAGDGQCPDFMNDATHEGELYRKP